MEHRPFEQRIEAYLTGQMSPEERAAFETELRSDADKKKAFQAHHLAELATRLRQPDTVSETANRLRKELGPLPKPSFSLLERIQEWIQSIWGKSIMVALLFIVGLFSYANLQLPDVCTLAQQAMVDPHNGAVAGNQVHELSEIYFYDKSNALKRLSEKAAECPRFCLAQYYLAHAQLGAGAFDLADNSFQSVLGNKDQWPPLIEEQKMRWNQWLTQQCGQAIGSAGQQALESFCNSPDEAVQKKANALREQLGHPLRMLYLR